MKNINFNNKTFLLIENSENGKTNSETIFKYQQKGNLVTADYYGGTIKLGKIIANLKDNKLHMLYQCLTNDNELRAGKAIADISLNGDNKIILTLNWQWFDEKKEKGISKYIEM